MPKHNGILTYRKLIDELESSSPKPIYFCCGEEFFFIDRIQEMIVGRVPAGERDFNLDVLYGMDTTIENILSICRSFPMMAEKRVVVVRDFFYLGESSTGEEGDLRNKPASLDELIPYIEHPNPSTLLLLIDERRPNGNTILGKAIKKNPNVGYYEFESIPDYKLSEWIDQWAEVHYKRHFDPPAAQLLAQHVGTNLLQLTVEIDKLCTYDGSSRPVGQEAVESLVGITREFTIFELKDAITNRDESKALFIARHMLMTADNVSGEIIRSVSFFYSSYTKLWGILKLKDRGLTPAQIKDKTGISNKYYFDNLMKDARKYTLAQMPVIFETLLDADAAIKGFTKMEPEDIFFFTIKKLMVR